MLFSGSVAAALFYFIADVNLRWRDARRHDQEIMSDLEQEAATARRGGEFNDVEVL